MFRTFDDPHLCAGFGVGPAGPEMILGIDGFTPPMQTNGVGAVFIPDGPSIGPAMPSIEYSSPVIPRVDHTSWIQNNYPPDNIYG